MAELTLEDWVPMSPLKGPPLPRFLDIYWPWYKEELPPEEVPPEEVPPEEVPPTTAADIRVEKLTVSPAQVNVGEKVTVSVTAKNYGTASGSKTITISVDGKTSSQTVNLAPGQSQQVNFEVTPTAAKTYSVSIDGLTGSFTAAAPVAPPFTMSITGITTQIDQYATSYWIAEITALIKNNSSVPATHDIRIAKCRPGQQDENNPASYPYPRYWSNAWNINLTLTLQPGQSVTVISPYYIYYAAESRYVANEDLMYHSGERIRYAWRVFDELNNMSPSAYAGSYP